MKDDVIITLQGDRLIAGICTDIDHHSAKNMREQIDNALFERKPRVLVLDFSKVGFMDSSGLGLILGRAEKASALGSSTVVVGLSPALMKLVRLSGIDRVGNLSVTR